MPATWIEFDPHTNPYVQWQVIEEFACSSPVVALEFRGSDRDSPLCGRHAIAHWREFSDIAFGTVHYAKVRYAAAREHIAESDTVVVYAFGTQVGQSHGIHPPHPEDLIDRARELLAE